MTDIMVRYHVFLPQGEILGTIQVSRLPMQKRQICTRSHQTLRPSMKNPLRLVHEGR